MNSMLVWLLPLIIITVGVVSLLWKRQKVRHKYAFAVAYFERFSAFIAPLMSRERVERGDGTEELFWLVKNSDKIQREAGSFGLVLYKPRGQSQYMKNYTIFENTMLNISGGTAEKEDVVLLINCLTRYMGYLEEIEAEFLKDMVNPLVWLREGVKFILGIPVLLLKEFGVIKKQSANFIIESKLFAVFSGIITLVAFLANCVTILIGKEQVIQIMEKARSLFQSN